MPVARITTARPSNNLATTRLCFIIDSRAEEIIWPCRLRARRREMACLAHPNYESTSGLEVHAKTGPGTAHHFRRDSENSLGFSGAGPARGRFGEQRRGCVRRRL